MPCEQLGGIQRNIRTSDNHKVWRQRGAVSDLQRAADMPHLSHRVAHVVFLAAVRADTVCITRGDLLYPDRHRNPPIALAREVRAWDARAWADGRPDKVTPRPGTKLEERWQAEFDALGYRPRDRPVALRPTPIGALDRPAAVERVLARLAAGRSALSLLRRLRVEHCTLGPYLAGGATALSDFCLTATPRALLTLII